MNRPFSIVTAKVIKNIAEANPEQIYESIKTAYIRHGNREADNPPSYFLKFPDKPKSRIIALPSSVRRNPRIAGIKWISSNPDNLGMGLKRASAVIILNDYDTGYPIACLEGSIISALRTVYSAILVCNLLITNRKVNTIGIVGAGNISENFIDCLYKQNWKTNKFKLFDLKPEACNELSSKIKQINPNIEVSVVEQLEKLIVSSEIIFLSTTAPSPYIQEERLFSHKPVVLNISLRDLTPEILINSNNIVDDIDHVLNANTSPHLTRQKYGHHKFINCTVNQLIEGYNDFDSNKPIIFSPMGMGVLDLMLASYIYDKAKTFSINISDFYG